VRKEIVRDGVVAELAGEYWGVQYQDGHCTAFGFGPIEHATVSDPRFCKHPCDLTYRGSSDIVKLNGATLIPVRVTTIYEVGALPTPEKPL
jgi:hypothetical protein